MNDSRSRRPETAPALLSSLNSKLSELEAAVATQAERFAAVLEIGAALATARDVDALLRLVVEKVAGLVRAEAATLFMYDETRKELWSRVLKGSGLKEIRVPARAGIVGHALRTGQSVLVADAYQDDRFNPDIDRKSGFKTRSIVAAPLRHVSGRLLGVLQVLDPRPGAFGRDEVSVVEAVAAQVAGVLDNVLLYEQLREQNAALHAAQEALSLSVREMDLLYELEKAISSADALPALVERILAKACEVIGAESAALVLKEDEGEALCYLAARGAPLQPLQGTTVRPGQGIAGHVASTGETVRVAEADGSPHFDKGWAKRAGVRQRAVLCVPVPGQRGRLGALELCNKAGGFDHSDERLATLLGGQAGRAVMLFRARAEGERKGRLAAIGQMLSGVLHDLRTPITIVSGYVQLLSVEEDPKLRAEFTQVIERQFEQINAMTRETLAFARGEREILIRRVFLHAFLPEVEEYLRRDFEHSGIELKMQVDYDGAARFDENKLKRLIYNIARNAAQAMPEGGRFTFTVGKEDDALLLRFADNGPGIPPEIADRLFEHFVSSGKQGGTGLGLAIVKKIAEEHGGTVTCKTRQGKGTTFEVRLPA